MNCADEFMRLFAKRCGIPKSRTQKEKNWWDAFSTSDVVDAISETWFDDILMSIYREDELFSKNSLL